MTTVTTTDTLNALLCARVKCSACIGSFNPQGRHCYNLCGRDPGQSPDSSYSDLAFLLKVFKPLELKCGFSHTGGKCPITGVQF